MVNDDDTAAAPRYAANVPPSIKTPDSVDTRAGTLRFFDGLPDEDTVQKVYDNLDFGRGVETFLAGIPATSVHALDVGLSSIGVRANEGIGITEGLADARALFLTPNSTVVYAWFCVDLSVGPVVVEIPPGVLGIIDDAYFRFVADLGSTGPDGGNGGKYLLVPPGHTATLPASGYFVQHPRTYINLFIVRAFVKDGDIAATVQSMKDHSRVYPLSAADDPPSTTFVDISGVQFNTVHANDFEFYQELNAVVQHEPADFVEPETAGLFAAIGIKKGHPFAPDARLRAILTDAVAVGNATARAIVFAPRDERTKYFPDRQWTTAFIGGSHEFIDGGERMLDIRALFHYYATGITPAMAAAKPGTGSAYIYTARDSDGQYFDGSKTYSVTLPAPVPVGRFWSFTIYDTSNPLHARNRPEVGGHRQHPAWSGGERRRFGDGLVRPGAAPRPRRQLGTNDARQELEHHPAAVCAAAAVVRQELEAERSGAGRLTYPGRVLSLVQPCVDALSR